MLTQYPYKSCFAELVIKPLVSEAKDMLLAKASLVEVSHFLPSIDTSINLDVLPVAFNACVINRVNKNRDVIDTATALAVYKNFINKPINVEHNRQKVIGTILTAGFSKFSTDEPLTEEEVKNLKGPFNVTLGGIIWRIVCPELSDHIEEASDPSSSHYLSVSASWELGFTDYKVALLPAGAKNLEEAVKILAEASEIEPIRDRLNSLGGDGKVDDLFAFRMPSADVLPLGIGFTEKPAAEVKGVATTRNDTQVGMPQNPAFDKTGTKDADKNRTVHPPKAGEAPEVGIKNKPAFDKSPDKQSLGGDETKNNFSQTPEINVKRERTVIMKITSIKDLTDETLKECTASAVSEFIAAELKKGSDAWLEEKNKLTTQLSQATENTQKLQSDHTALQEQMKQLKATVDTLNAEKAEREQVEKFNTRMATVAEQYEFDDEVRAAIVEEIKALASDEDFNKWQAKAKVLLKGFAKKKEEKKEDCKDDKAKCKAEDAEAKAKEAVASAVENGEKDKGGLPNGTSADKKSLKEVYATAFAMENFVITK